jgi:hypothetical protein
LPTTKHKKLKRGTDGETVAEVLKHASDGEPLKKPEKSAPVCFVTIVVLEVDLTTAVRDVEG